MAMQPELDALRRQLADAGIAPACVARLTRELRDHFRDLEHEARRAGYAPDEAEIDACERLGSCAAIAGEFARRPELRSWLHSLPLIRALRRACASRSFAVGTPLRSLAAGPDALKRYAAAGAAGAAITAGLLLSMVGALAPEDRQEAHATRVARAPLAMHAQPRAQPATSPRMRRGAASEPSAASPSSVSGANTFRSIPVEVPTDVRIAAPARQRPIFAERDTYGAALAAQIITPPDFAPRLRRAALALRDSLPWPIARGHVADDTRISVGAATEYPRVAARLGIEGYVVVEYSVSRRGTVEDALVVESSHELFNRAALDTARRMTFPPRIVSGEAVELRGVRTTVRFLIDG